MKGLILFWPFALTHLLQICLISNVGALAKSSQTILHEGIDPDFVPTQEQLDDYWNHGGNDAVHEIWSVLRNSEPTRPEKIKHKPTGMINTAWHYTKALLRLLFMNTSHEKEDGISKDLQTAVESLYTATQFQDLDAMFIMAEMYFYGNFSHPRDMSAALEWYRLLAKLSGNSTAQYMMGLIYGTELGGMEADQSKSLAFHTFAAEQGNIRSEMTLAFKHHAGIGTARNCDKAAYFYKQVADKAMAYWRSGPPGGYTFARNIYRWVEMTGGSYGEGASASSSGANAPRDSVVAGDFDNVLEYLEVRGRQGDFNAILTLGKYYYEPPRGYQRNLKAAFRHFLNIAKVYWSKDGNILQKHPKNIDRAAGKAAAYIGRMWLRGEGLEQNFEKALKWFRLGVTNGDSFAQYHLGLMYRDGYGVAKDGMKAAGYLKAAAEQNLPVAHAALGQMFLDQGDVDTAARYFELAASNGNLEAFYYLAELTDKGIGRERNCGLATAYYKVVAEKAEILHSSFVEANSAYERGDYERALLPMIMAAEQGYEHAQANVALLLDRKTSMLPIFSKKTEELLDNPAQALVYYTRSAKQANTDALVKMGDYYISGTNRQTADLEKAVSCYTAAAEGHHSAQALWNMGWLHENGIGSVAQDFHMAKRYYDLALEMNKEAYLPVKLALMKLRLRSWWNGVTGGKVNSIRDEDEDSHKRPRSLSEWISKFLDAAEQMDAQEQAQEDELDSDPLAYAEGGMPGGDSDYSTTQEEWDEIDDGLVESLIIVALAGALAMLIYARQQRQRQLELERLRQQGQVPREVPGQVNPNGGEGNGNGNMNLQGPGQGGGFFPHPGDPEFNNWAVGGVGH